ncbi:AMIN-like domain-containing (lipo)protein [Georgenia sp. Z1344]|uniref:AMIN-like domain-containing (lipo)protein n=1 Tax=Georgenia sp. Z1344 TaxID=3416706 RepID=UPI003CF0B2FB
MRARRAAATAATAALLVTLVACSAEDDSGPDDGANVDTPTQQSGSPSEDSPTEAPSSEEGTGSAESGSAAESGSESGSDLNELEDEDADGSDGAAGATEEGSSDEQEPGGTDAQWISPGSSDEGAGDPAGGPLLAVDVRSGIHPYYDRVVVDLEGEGGNPGWYADYTGDPVEDGSGTPIDIDGNAFLHVSVSGFRYPEEGEEFADGVYAVDGTGVTEAYVSSPFEGQIQVVLGVDSARPYRVFVLPDPLRLVIDIEIAG